MMATAEYDPDDYGHFTPLDVGPRQSELPAPVDWSSFWNREHEEGEWLVEPLIPARRHVAVYSPSKAGKSLLGLEMAAGLATGRAVLGQSPAAPIHVVYFDLEMTEDDLWERLSDLGYGPDDDLSRLHYYLLPPLEPLDTAEGGDQVAAIVRRNRAEFVVVDTMARAVRGDEDAADTYRGFFRHTGRALRAEGVALLRLDHSGKDLGRGQRGSSAKNDDVDLVWRLTADRTMITLKATHRRLSWVPEEVTLLRETEPLVHRCSEDTWPAGTADTAAELDRLEVPLDATTNVATTALRAHGHGRRKAIVAAALRFRRSTPGGSQLAGTVLRAFPGTEGEPS